ncbi:MAG: hypothetical protein ACXADC_00655 [Candidatus Thorarchaeota archaeon]|jgi:hypothetical protein
MTRYREMGSFRPDDPPSGSISVNQVADWLWVKARLSYEGTTMDQTTDRLGGDPYEANVSYDWIGDAKTAPAKPSNASELDAWAAFKTRYVSENTDVGLWGEHGGSWVENLAEDGSITLYEASGRYQDVSPESTAEKKELKL